jgi:hypothetical protein
MMRLRHGFMAKVRVYLWIGATLYKYFKAQIHSLLPIRRFAYYFISFSFVSFFG